MRYSILFFLISVVAFAQKTRPFVGCGVYIDSDFKNSTFVDFKLGTEYKATYYLKPEIEISYMFGNLEELTNRDNAGLVLSDYSKKVAALNFSFCPKIILGNKDEDGTAGYLQILPKYTYSRIEANGYLLSKNPNNASKTTETNETILDTKNSIGIGIGYVLYFSEGNSDSIALNLYFNNIDLGNALNGLKQERRYKTNDVVGFGVNYYFSFKHKKQL